MEISASQPRFHHPEIENLYQYGFELPPAIIDSILQLPRDSVIEDLETVLNDTMIRFEDFQMLDWTRQTHSISFHAMMLLGALRSERSLPLLLKVHQQPADWIDFWFSDWFWDSMWEPLVWCGMNQIEVLAAFVKKNEVGDEYAMTNVVEAIAQIGFYFPEKRAEVVHFLEDLFHFFMKRDASGDSEKQRTQVEISVTALAGAVYNLREDSLLPLLEECYEREMVDWGMYGFWGDFMKMYEEENRREYKIFPNVTDWYAHEWKAEQKREAQAQKWLEEQKLQEKRVKKTPLIQYLPTNDRPVSRPAKIGRNEPCPCGSGKKYKRCCGTGQE